MPLSGGSKLITGAERFGFRATDGGLRPPPPISVEPSGMPTGPTDEPGPIEEASGTDAVADAAHGPGAVAVMPPASKSALPDNVVLEFPVAAYAPIVGVPAAVEAPIPADAPVIGLDVMADVGAGEAPAHVAPIKGEAPNVVGLTPGVASSIAPMGIPVCRTAHWECQAARLSQAAGGGTHSGGLAHKQSRNPKGLPPSLSQRVSAWNLTLSRLRQIMSSCCVRSLHSLWTCTAAPWLSGVPGRITR
jgi:hypothetical protein